MKTQFKLVLLLGLLFICKSSEVHAGLSGSVGYDILPYQDIDEPIKLQNDSLIDDAQVRISKINFTLEYPVIYAQGRTILFHQLAYQNMQFDYKKTESILHQLHRVSYTATMIRQLTEKWSMIAMVNPSIASDFEEGLTSEDMSFQAAAIFKINYSPKLSIGYGLAYSTQFGTAIPLPLIMIEWNNGGKWSLSSTLPANLELWYQSSEKVKLGLLIRSDGDNYHFDPQGYQVERPELRYIMMTFGPAAHISFSKKATLKIETGIIGLHRFEFYSGDEEIISNDLKPSGFARAGLQLEF